MNGNAGEGKRADASSAGTEPGKQNKRVEMLRGQRKRADTSSAGTELGRQQTMHRSATWPAEKGGHQQ